MIISRFLIGATAVALVAGCGSVPNASGIAPHDVNNSPGRATNDIDPTRRGPVAGIGIEGQDLNAIADTMVRDMLQNPVLANSQRPPSVEIDAMLFSNQSSQQINKNLIIDRLRNELIRSAAGRMVFVDRQSLERVLQEKELRANNVVNGGTVAQTQGTAAVDYQLRATMTTLDAHSATAGDQRSTQIEFEMFDTDRGIIVWSNIYTIDRHAMDDVVYR